MSREQRIKNTEKEIRELIVMGIFEQISTKEIRQAAEMAVEGDALASDFLTEGNA